MAYPNRPQKAILVGWILPICLLVVLSNCPTGVAGWDLSSLVSFSSRGLRGSQQQQQQQQPEEEDYLDFVEDFDAADAGAPNEEQNREEEQEQDRERELHPGHSSFNTGYTNTYRSNYGVPYRATNVRGWVDPYRTPSYSTGFYGGYYRYYGYTNRRSGFYTGYNNGYNTGFNNGYTTSRNYNRAYYASGFDDWTDDAPVRSNFWV